MNHVLFTVVALMPALAMLGAGLAAQVFAPSRPYLWRTILGASGVALVCALITVGVRPSMSELQPWFSVSTFGAVLALLVQLLGTVIAAFSARYLDGEPGQQRYVVALAGVLAAVHVLLMADHWLVVIAAWALVGMALQDLLCFYQDRPFALLAAHKKQIADRVADVLLIGAAALAWNDVGSGSLSALWTHIDERGMSTALQISAVALVLAVILRTALLPVHGWLIQVMEAPTPVSALLHAGVVNLGGFVLIRFAPVLEQADVARGLLVVFGLATAVLAGMVMLTRISIKVRLAWSTVAQMGFMLLECGLGLYTLAALHLLGHSLYKAHAFLSASTAVRQTRLQAMHVPQTPALLSLILAPAVTILIVLLVQSLSGHVVWAWWWSVVLGLAWAPMLWLPAVNKTINADLAKLTLRAVLGMLMVIGLTAVALLAHALPLGLHDAPHNTLGVIAMLGMTVMYAGLAALQLQVQQPRSTSSTSSSTLSAWRRWSYAGFYLDEAFTRLALQIWPTQWATDTSPAPAITTATTPPSADAA
jgi:NAD(P)H-quinone oxidoreductase subunit 5